MAKILLEDFIQTMDEKEYANISKSMGRIDAILTEHEKCRHDADKQEWAAEQLTCELKLLTTAVNFEKKYQNGTRAIDFSVKNLPLILSKARDMADSHARKKLFLAANKLRMSLPTGCWIEPIPPKIISGYQFEKIVLAVCKKLPESVQRFAGQNCTFIEIGAGKITEGVFLSAQKKQSFICIAADLGGDRLEKIIAHELAHFILNHTDGGAENEKAAESQARAWGF